MYFQQLKNSPRNNFKYYIPAFVFFAFIFVPQFFSDANQTNHFIQVLIKNIGKNPAFVFLIMPLCVLCIVLLLWVKFFHKQSITSLTTSRNKVDWSRIIFSFTIWSSYIIFFTIVGYLVSPEMFQITFQPIPFLIFFCLALLLLPLQTSFEEFLFRGYLMQGIGLVAKNRWIPLIITSVLFGLVHLANPEVGQMGAIIMIYYIGTGFLLGIMTLMDDGLELALGFHAANNIMTALLVTSDWSALQTHSVLKQVINEFSYTDFIIPIVIVYPLLIFVLAKKYHWTDWKQKLFGKI